MYCSFCGRQVAGTDLFCPHCGKRIRRKETPKTITLRINMNKAPKIVIGLFLMCTLLIGGGSILYQQVFSFEAYCGRVLKQEIAKVRPWEVYTYGHVDVIEYEDSYSVSVYNDTTLASIGIDKEDFSTSHFRFYNRNKLYNY